MRARTVALFGLGAAVTAALVVRARRVDRTPLAVVDEGERHEVHTSDGATLVVDVVGPDDGPVVVLAHCWGGHIENWSLVAGPLVDQGHRVVRWHQRGHGSSTTGDEGFAIERFGTDLAEVLQALDLRDAVVAGHSLGGMTTQAFAIHHPDVAADRVRGLVLVGTTAGGLGRAPVARVVEPLITRSGLADRAMAGRYGHVLVRGTLGRGATPAAVRATRDHFVGTALDTRVGILRDLLAMDLREAGATIAVPTTVVVGSRDPLTPPRHSKAMAATIPDARLVVLRGKGHMLPLEAPDELVDVITGHTTT